jgi:hypothetical protein
MLGTSGRGVGISGGVNGLPQADLCHSCLEGQFKQAQAGIDRSAIGVDQLQDTDLATRLSAGDGWSAGGCWAAAVAANAGMTNTRSNAW